MWGEEGEGDLANAKILLQDLKIVLTGSFYWGLRT